MVDDRRDANPEAGYASPACLLSEVDDAYAGYMTRAEVVALLHGLLRSDEFAPADCAILAGHIRNLGGDPDGRTEAAEHGSPDPGGAIRRALPRVRDDGLHADLRRLLERRE